MNEEDLHDRDEMSDIGATVMQVIARAKAGDTDGVSNLLGLNDDAAVLRPIAHRVRQHERSRRRRFTPNGQRCARDHRPVPGRRRQR